MLSIPDLIRRGRVIQLCYSGAFMANPESVNLSALGYEVADVIYGLDKGMFEEATVPYGVVARDKQDGTYHCFIVGTRTLVEWEEDAEAAHVQCPFLPDGCLSHAGFTRLYASLATKDGTPLKTILVPLQASVNGHSLGAALATLAAVDLPNPGVCNTLWAAPRVFNGSSAQWISKFPLMLARLINPIDPVPMLPVSELDWQHVGFEYPVTNTVDLPVEAHFMANYLAGLQTQCTRS